MWDLITIFVVYTLLCIYKPIHWVSQVVLVVKNLSASAGDYKRYVFDPWVGKIPWGRRWQPTPLFLPGEFHEQRSLVGPSPWGCKESDMTKRLTFFKKVMENFICTNLWIITWETVFRKALRTALPVTGQSVTVINVFETKGYTSKGMLKVDTV